MYALFFGYDMALTPLTVRLILLTNNNINCKTILKIPKLQKEAIANKSNR